jgi:hypothetical protein
MALSNVDPPCALPLAAEWDDIRERSASLALGAEKVAFLGGSEHLARDELRGCVSEQARQRISELTDIARAETLEMFGETERAMKLVERRLRSPAGAAPPADASGPSAEAPHDDLIVACETQRTRNDRPAPMHRPT